MFKVIAWFIIGCYSVSTLGTPFLFGKTRGTYNAKTWLAETFLDGLVILLALRVLEII